MSDQFAKSDQPTKRAEWLARFLRKPTLLEWLVIAGIIVVIYALCFMPEMDIGTAEWKRIKEQQRQIKSGQGERPVATPEKLDSPTESR